MAVFQPVDILEMNLGAATGGQPWRMPVETWRELENFFLKKGSLHVRQGQELLGRLRPIWTMTLAGTDTETEITGTLNKLPVVPAGEAPSLYTIEWDTGTPGIAVDDGEGNILLGIDVIGTIDYTTGEFEFELPAPADQDVEVTWEQEAALPVVGLLSLYLRSGNEYLVAMDTKRLYTWNGAQMRFIDQTLADTFSGNSGDFFHMVPFHNRLILSNGVNPVHQYEPLGAGVSELPTDFDSGVGGNDLDWAKIIVRHKDALHFLNVQENATVYGQRARRTRFGDPTAYLNDLTFADMPTPTNARIVSAVDIGDSIIVFTDRYEAWRYRFQQDPKAPYAWEQIEPAFGSSTPHGTVQIPGGALTLDTGGLIVTDGQRVDRLKPEIHDGLPMNMNPELLRLCWGTKFPFRNEAWITFAQVAHDDPNAILVYWAPGAAIGQLTYPIPVRCLGTFRGTATTLTWHDVGDIYGTWDEVVIAPDSQLAANDDVEIVGGTIDGRIYTLLTALQDPNDTPIVARAKSNLISFFQGQEARLGWVDLQMSRAARAKVRFYRDFVEAYYFEQVVEADEFAETPEGTVSIRLDVNQIATYHAFEVIVEDSPGTMVHGLTAYVCPVGLKKQTPRMRAVVPAAA